MNNFLNKFSLSTPWDQKLAYIISKPFIFFRVHPNIVTVIGILFGTASLICYSFGNLFYAKIASLLFFIAACFDHVDGEVARKLNKSSTLGHYLDHVGVCLSYIFLFVSLSGNNIFKIDEAANIHVVLFLSSKKVGEIGLINSTLK